MALGFLVLLGGCATREPLPTVPEVDLARYSGTWHEIAKYPNFFQRRCASDTKAIYEPMADGRIRVVNSCRNANGREQRVSGTATVVPDSGNARLRVSFWGPFAGDYWIIGLDPDYRWALVGHPSRKFLWILSRTPEMDDTTYRRIVKLATDLGYDPSRIERSRP